MTTATSTASEQPPQILLPQWMYRQIISDKTTTAVWCFCGAPAITYCNGLQFVCHGGGHFGVPMVMLKPRAEEQAFLDEQCHKGREATATANRRRTKTTTQAAKVTTSKLTPRVNETDSR